MPLRLCIAGATGVTGRMVTSAARQAGIEVVLAGRDHTALERLRGELGDGEVRRIDLDDATSLDAAIADCGAVANCVGPFTRRGLAVAEAAARTDTPYVDTCGEPRFCLNLIERFPDTAAPLVTAVGVSSLLGDLAAAITRQRGTPAGDSLTIAYRLAGMRPSAGTLRSTLDIVGAGAVNIEGGQPVVVRPGGRPYRLPTGAGVLFAVPDPLVISLYHPAKRIEAYLVAPGAPVVGAGMRIAARLLERPMPRRVLDRALGYLPDRDVTNHGTFAVTVSDGAQVVTASSRDTYRLTAHAVVRVAQALATWTGPGGVRAASEVLGDPNQAARSLGIDIS